MVLRVGNRSHSVQSSDYLSAVGCRGLLTPAQSFLLRLQAHRLQTPIQPHLSLIARSSVSSEPSEWAFIQAVRGNRLSGRVWAAVAHLFSYLVSFEILIALAVDVAVGLQILVIRRALLAVLPLLPRHLISQLDLAVMCLAVFRHNKDVSSPPRPCPLSPPCAVHCLVQLTVRPGNRSRIVAMPCIIVVGPAGETLHVDLDVVHNRQTCRRLASLVQRHLSLLDPTPPLVLMRDHCHQTNTLDLILEAQIRRSG